MDDNLSKALIMAGGVLLSILLISFLMFSKNKMSSWGDVQNEKKVAEQVEKFNKEYEVYDKDLMYGVDVISCTNKILSNNEKINNEYGENLDESYEIKEEIILKKALAYEMTVYYMKDGKEQIYSEGEGPKSNRMKISDAGFEIFNTLSDNESTSKWKEGWKNYETTKFLISMHDESNTFPAATYEVSSNKIYRKKDNTKTDITKSNVLTTKLSETVVNSNPLTFDEWTKATYKTPIYDLKQRKFKCTDFKYNDTTGRVNYIKFEEY